MHCRERATSPINRSLVRWRSLSAALGKTRAPTLDKKKTPQTRRRNDHAAIHDVRAFTQMKIYDVPKAMRSLYTMVVATQIYTAAWMRGLSLHVARCIQKTFNFCSKFDSLQRSVSVCVFRIGNKCRTIKQ